MTDTEIVHEGGLVSTSAPESSRILTYGLRAILAIEGGDHEVLLSSDGASLSVQVSSLALSTTDVAFMVKTFALSYDIGAAVHHCANLAKAYRTIVAKFRRLRAIPGYQDSESGFTSFGYQAEPYYELDALLSAARRGYDKLGHCVWQAFEGGGAGMPNNMEDLLSQLKRCPPPLRDRMATSWTNVGLTLKNYRDCTQHFASTDLGLGTVMMKRLEGDVWRAWARIPDNPEAKSKKKFTYTDGRDALTYGWEIVNEVTALAIEVVAAAATAHQ